MHWVAPPSTGITEFPWPAGGAWFARGGVKGPNRDRTRRGEAKRSLPWRQDRRGDSGRAEGALQTCSRLESQIYSERAATHRRNAPVLTVLPSIKRLVGRNFTDVRKYKE